MSSSMALECDASAAVAHGNGVDLLSAENARRECLGV
jgi:hypothetical protein